MHVFVRLVTFGRANFSPLPNRLLRDEVLIILARTAVILSLRTSHEKTWEGIFSTGVGDRVLQRGNVDSRTVGLAGSEVGFAEWKTVNEVLAVGVDLIPTGDMAGAELGLGEMANAGAERSNCGA